MQQGITHSVTKVFLVAIGLSVVSFAVALLVRELPLRTSADGEAVMAMAD